MMPRIFASLAVAEMLLLMLTGAIGLAKLDVHADRHVLLALLSLLLSCLIQVVLFTYFSVTGRMITQAVHLGGLSTDAVAQVQRLKRMVLWCLCAVVVTVLLVTISGAILWRGGRDVPVHLALAAVAFGVHGVMYYVQYRLVSQGKKVLDRTLDAYRRRRGVASASRNAP